jgi:thiol-disulfide isomerase/thioredoxin
MGPTVCAAAELAPVGTTVKAYSPGCAERYAALGKKTVLFFRAYWCGACADAAAHIADEAKAGPADLVILEVDYDDSAELRRLYGVTLQHTFVQVDGRGEEVGQWIGFGTLAELYAALR